MKYRASIALEVDVEAPAVGRAMQAVADEIKLWFAGVGTVEIIAADVRIYEPTPPGDGFPAAPPEMLELNRRMVEAMERAHPKKDDYSGG